MEHPDEEILTQFALDDPLALDAATLVHITDCEGCAQEIQEIQRVVDAALASGGRADLRTTVAPPASVWERVLVEVGGRGTGAADDVTARTARPGPAVPAADPVGGDWPAAPPAGAGEQELPWLFEQPGEIATSARGHSDEVDQPTDRRTLWQVAVAGVVGLVLGAGVAWLVAGNDSTPTVSGDAKTSALSGVDGNPTSGEVSLVERGGALPSSPSTSTSSTGVPDSSRHG